MKLCNEEHEMICYTSDRCPLCVRIKTIEELEEELFAKKTRESFSQSIAEKGAFRLLNTEEEEEFKKWARDNPPHKNEDYHIYHPVVIKEWERLDYKLK